MSANKHKLDRFDLTMKFAEGGSMRNSKLWLLVLCLALLPLAAAVAQHRP